MVTKTGFMCRYSSISKQDAQESTYTPRALIRSFSGDLVEVNMLSAGNEYTWMALESHNDQIWGMHAPGL